MLGKIPFPGVMEIEGARSQLTLLGSSCPRREADYSACGSSLPPAVGAGGTGLRRGVPTSPSW